MSILGDRIKKLREAAGMSQMDLAIELKYSDRSTIAKIEKGVNDLTQSKIEAFAIALKTTPAYLMGWTDDILDDEEPILPDSDPIGALFLLPDDEKELLSKYRAEKEKISAKHDEKAMNLSAIFNILQNEEATIPVSESSSISVLKEAKALFDLFNRLNCDGQQKLLDYAADLVASGRYAISQESDIKLDASELKEVADALFSIDQ